MQPETKAKIVENVSRLLDEVDESMQTVEHQVNDVSEKFQARCQPHIERLREQRKYLKSEYDQFASASEEKVDQFYAALQARARSFSTTLSDLLAEKDDSGAAKSASGFDIAPPTTDIGYPNPELLAEYERAIEQQMHAPFDKSSADKPGEGNVAADRRYRKAASEFASDEERLDDAAEQARKDIDRREAEIAESKGRAPARH